MSQTVVRFLFNPAFAQTGGTPRALTAILFRSEDKDNSLYVKKHLDLSYLPGLFPLSKENSEFLNAICNKDWQVEEGISMLSTFAKIDTTNKLNSEINGFIDFCMRFI